MFLGALIAQLILVPALAASLAEDYPQVAHLQVPYLVAVTVAIGGFEVAVVAAWRLLVAAAVDTVAAPAAPAAAADTVATAAEWPTTDRVHRWANIMAVSLGVMAVALAGVFLHAGWVENIGGPPMLFGLLASMAVLLTSPVLSRGVMLCTGGFTGVRATRQHWRCWVCFFTKDYWPSTAPSSRTPWRASSEVSRPASPGSP
ncbi:hypothetical protein GCM10009673_11850 [Nesterenkonia sandarakina]